MHHIYHTEGIILSSRNFGEAGKHYRIFTRDLGMIYASAQGVRKMSSKLRFVLQDLAYVRIDLVKTRDFWRLTSASKTNLLGGITKEKSTLIIFSNMARLLERLLAGEYPNEILFQDFFNGLLLLEQNKDKEKLSDIEVVLVLRILNNLGYIGTFSGLDALIKSPVDLDLIPAVFEKKKEILREINKALKETHL